MGRRFVLALVLAVLPFPLMAQQNKIPETGYLKRSSVYLKVPQRGKDSVDTQISNGTGFLISPEGFLLTAMQVVNNYITESMEFRNRWPIMARIGSKYSLLQYEAKVIDWDDRKDIALLQIVRRSNEPFNSFPICRRDFRIGDTVSAGGFPLEEDFVKRDCKLQSPFGPRGTWRVSCPFKSGMTGGPLTSGGPVIERKRVVGIFRGGGKANKTVRFVTPIQYGHQLLGLDLGDLPPCPVGNKGPQIMAYLKVVDQQSIAANGDGSPNPPRGNKFAVRIGTAADALSRVDKPKLPTGLEPCNQWIPKQKEPRLSDVQKMLIWTGYYDGLVDNKMGSKTRDAIIKYQTSIVKEISDYDKGYLSNTEYEQLRIEGMQAMQQVGFTVVKDAPTGICIGLPRNMVGPGETTNYRTARSWGRKWDSPEGDLSIDVYVEDPSVKTAGQLIVKYLKSPKGYKRTYEFIYLNDSEDDLVVSGRDEPVEVTGHEIERKSQEFYIRAKAHQKQWKAVSIYHELALKERMDVITAAMSSTFEPTWGEEAPAAEGSYVLRVD